MNKLARWYRREGFIQFLLGACWNDPQGDQQFGRQIVVSFWLVVSLELLLWWFR